MAQEPGTVSWFAFRVDTQTFGIFDSFADASGRQAHINGAIAAALFSRADELLAEHPIIHPVDIVAQRNYRAESATPGAEPKQTAGAKAPSAVREPANSASTGFDTRNAFGRCRTAAARSCFRYVAETFRVSQ